jgi:hypothetical protein
MTYKISHALATASSVERNVLEPIISRRAVQRVSEVAAMAYQ